VEGASFRTTLAGRLVRIAWLTRAIRSQFDMMCHFERKRKGIQSELRGRIMSLGSSSLGLPAAAKSRHRSPLISAPRNSPETEMPPDIRKTLHKLFRRRKSRALGIQTGFILLGLLFVPWLRTFYGLHTLCLLRGFCCQPLGFFLLCGFYHGSKISLTKRTLLLKDSSNRYQLFSTVWANLCLRYTTWSETHKRLL